MFPCTFIIHLQQLCFIAVKKCELPKDHKCASHKRGWLMLRLRSDRLASLHIFSLYSYSLWRTIKPSRYWYNITVAALLFLSYNVAEIISARCWRVFLRHVHKSKSAVLKQMAKYKRLSCNCTIWNHARRWNFRTISTTIKHARAVQPTKTWSNR